MNIWKNMLYEAIPKLLDTRPTMVSVILVCEGLNNTYHGLTVFLLLPLLSLIPPFRSSVVLCEWSFHSGRSDGEVPAVSLALGSLCTGLCSSWLQRESTWLFYTGWLVFTQLNFGQLISTWRVHNRYKNYRKTLYWGDEVVSPGPTINFPCNPETLIWEQTAGLFSIPFALLLRWKGARGRGARDFCIAGGIPGQWIGNVLFVGFLSTIAPSVKQHAYLWCYSYLANNNYSSSSKHGNSKYAGKCVIFSFFFSKTRQGLLNLMLKSGDA